MAEKRLPKLCHHRATGRWYVTLQGARHYLGKDQEEAERRRLVLLAGARAGVPPRAGQATVAVLVGAHAAWSEGYYRGRDGEPTGEAGVFRMAYTALLALVPALPVVELAGPHVLALQEHLVARGLARKTINAVVRRVRRILRWGVARGLVPLEVLQRASAVQALAAGRTAAPERPRVRPAPEADVAAVLQMDLRHCPWWLRQAQDMVRVQLASGCRPGEVCALRADEIDRTGARLAEALGEPVDVGSCWLYLPGSHKTAWRGSDKVIPLPLSAQGVLAPYLLREPTGWLFRGPVSGGPPLEQVYHHWVARLCDLASVWPFAPNRIRHLVATRLERTHGLEAARAVLGHTTVDTTRGYIAADAARACRAVEGG